MSADALDGPGWEGAAGIQCAEGRVLLHVRQRTGVPMTNSYLAPDVCGAEVAKPCSNLQYSGGSADKKQGPLVHCVAGHWVSGKLRGLPVPGAGVSRGWEGTGGGLCCSVMLKRVPPFTGPVTCFCPGLDFCQDFCVPVWCPMTTLKFGDSLGGHRTQRPFVTVREYSAESLRGKDTSGNLEDSGHRLPKSPHGIAQDTLPFPPMNCVTCASGPRPGKPVGDSEPGAFAGCGHIGTKHQKESW